MCGCENEDCSCCCEGNCDCPWPCEICGLFNDHKLTCPENPGAPVKIYL